MSVSDDSARGEAPGLPKGHQNGEAHAEIAVASPRTNADRPDTWSTSAEDDFLATRTFKEWSQFERRHGDVVMRHFCATIPSGAVLTSSHEIHLDLPRVRR